MVKPELMKLIPRTGIILIIGRRGAGKSVLAHALLEELHFSRKCFVYNFPQSDVLPSYIHSTDELEFEEGSVVLVDEGYMNFSARRGMSQNNKFIDNLNGLARQKDLLIIYITQEAARIDINIVRGIEVLLVKALSINQVRFERKEMRTFLQDVKSRFDLITDKKDLFSSVYVTCDTLDNKFEGMIYRAVTPPHYWNDRISKAWAGVSLKGEEENVKKNKKKKLYKVVETDDKIYTIYDDGEIKDVSKI